jgi:hypothetical protein
MLVLLALAHPVVFGEGPKHAGTVSDAVWTGVLGGDVCVGETVGAGARRDGVGRLEAVFALLRIVGAHGEEGRWRGLVGRREGAGQCGCLVTDSVEGYDMARGGLVWDGV